MELHIHFREKKLLKGLGIILLFLLALHLVAVYMNHYLPKPASNITESIVGWFDFNGEGNFPTLYSALLFFISAMLLYLITINEHQEKRKIKWRILCIVFIYLGVDEGVIIHEKFISIVRSFFEFLEISPSDLFHYGWIIPYGIIFIVLGIYLLDFLKNLPLKTRKLFILSGLIFVIGALGFEMLGGRQDKLYGRDNLAYVVYYTFEEFLEMTGLIVFIYSLVGYLKYVKGQAGSKDAELQNQEFFRILRKV